MMSTEMKFGKMPCYFSRLLFLHDPSQFEVSTYATVDNGVRGPIRMLARSLIVMLRLHSLTYIH